MQLGFAGRETYEVAITIDTPPQLFRMRESKYVKRWLTMSPLGIVAFSYVALDYWKDHITYLPSQYAKYVQPLLWLVLVLMALRKVPLYSHWKLEILEFPKFIAAILFMTAMLFTEVLFVQLVSVMPGLDWHGDTSPLPDPGQWILLALNSHLPSPLVTILRSRLIELHHYLMLFIILGFSTLFGYVRPSGLGFATRYCTAMGLGRIARIVIFSATILPSPRPWCAAHRFVGTPSYPNPWAQQYWEPYSKDHTRIWKVIQRDECFVPKADFPPEYTPDWGRLQFLVSILRPPDPATGADTSDKLFGIVRPGGGCNDLAISGHMVVAVLTACAWHEAHPGLTSILIWLLTLHSGQREIRERHHYTLDVVVACFIGIALWRFTAPLWSPHTSQNPELGKVLGRRADQLQKAAKEGDMESVRQILEEANKMCKGQSGNHTNFPLWLGVGGILLSCLGFALIVIEIMRGG